MELEWTGGKERDCRQSQMGDPSTSHSTGAIRGAVAHTQIFRFLLSIQRHISPGSIARRGQFVFGGGAH